VRSGGLTVDKNQALEREMFLLSTKKKLLEELILCGQDIFKENIALVFIYFYLFPQRT
jgi:hypothetical protein